MKPAARLGDMTAHGTPLVGTSSPNVLIGKRPAWRAGVDFHTCPMVTGVVPHVGGVVLKGSSNVFINKMPAARMGDKIIENGPPNTILGGCPTVHIG